MQGAVESIVDGLFSALVTLGTVPIIKCPKVWQGLSAMCELIFVLVFSAICKFIKDISNSNQVSFSCMHITKSLALFLGDLACWHKHCFSRKCLSNACSVHPAGLWQYGSLCTAMQAHVQLAPERQGLCWQVSAWQQQLQIRRKWHLASWPCLLSY